MRKLLAVVLSIGIVWGTAPAASAAIATHVAAPATALPAGAPGAIGAQAFSVTPAAVTLSNTFTLSPTPLQGAPSAALAPITLAAPPAAAVYSVAAAQAAASVERHPALAMIADVQKAGGGALLTQLEAARTPAQFEAVAAALPDGAAKASIREFAAALSAQGGAASISAIYENSRSAELMPKAETPAVTGFWATIATWKMPKPLAALRRYALKKAEAARPTPTLIDTDALKVPVEKLRWVPDPKGLPEKASMVEKGVRRVVGQDRAIESLEFGLKMDAPGFNVIVTGADGTGRETAVREILGELAPRQENPGDVVAAANFEKKDSPVILKMAAGEGAKFVAGAQQTVMAMPRALNKALSSGQAAMLRKKITAQVQKNASDREKAFQREAARVAVAGGFSIEVGAQQTDETHIGIISALTKNGVRVKPEEIDKLVEGTGVSKEQVMADFQAKARPLIEKYSEILHANMQEQAQAQAQLAMVEQSAAAEVVQELIQPLAALVSGAAGREDAEDHVAWRAKAEKVLGAWQAKVAALKVAGAFGVAVGEGISLTYEGEPISNKSFEQLKAKGVVPAGLTWEAVVQQALAAIQPLMAEQKAIAEALNAEHEALHANDPAPSPARQAALAWVQSFAQDLVNNWSIFKGESEMDPTERYIVSLLADNAKTTGAPVIFEKTPTFNNLFGYAEDNKKIMMMPNGAMMKREAPGGPTLKGGSFLRAGGGYLVLNLMDVLREPGVYQYMMRMIRNEKAEIVEGGIMGLISGKQGDSYQVDAKVKVVFIGSPYLKMLLAHNDEDFARHFRAVAEFDNSFKIAADTMKGYLRFMRDAVTSGTTHLMDFSREAIAGVLENAARMAESNEKLTAQFGSVYTLMVEAAFWARQAGRGVVGREDVDKAVDQRAERNGMTRRHMQEYYGNEIFRVQIAGSEVGQNNGLAVMGDFGVPSRITYAAYARPGSDFLVSADQAAHSTGSSFDKSIADIKGFLKSMFGRNKTVPVEVSIAFEQQYGGIDGDSATQTMTYGVLSAMSGVPIKQGIAMTGSMDQKGNVQVIGGVNHKIEGYFDVVTEMLRRQGKEMNGEQGIMIPVANIGDLSLRADVVEAVKAGRFHIWGVTHVSQGVEILTGVPYAEVLRKAEAYIASVRTGAAGSEK